MAQNNFAVQSDKDGNIQWPKSSTNFKGGINVNGLDVAQQIKSNTFNPIKAFTPNQPVNESYIDTKYNGDFARANKNTPLDILSDNNTTITFTNVKVSGSENDNPDTTRSYGIKLTDTIEMYLGQWVRVKIKCENLIMPNFYDPNTNLKYSECFDDFGNLTKEPGTIVFYLRLNDPDNTSNAYPETGKYGPMVLHRYSQNAVSDFKYVMYNVDPDNEQNTTQKFNSYGITGSYGQIYQMPYIAKIENSQVFNKTKIGTQFIDMYIRLDPTIFENYSYGSDISSIEKLPVQLFMTVPTGYNISGSITIESVETIKSTADFIDLYQISFGKYASGNTNWANQLQGGEVYAYNRRFVRYEQEYVGDIGETEKNDYTYKSGKSVILPPKLRLDCGVKIPQTGSLTVDAIWMYDNKTGKYRKVTLYDGMLNLADEDEKYTNSNSYGTYRNNYYGSSSEDTPTDYNIPNYYITGKKHGTIQGN